MTRKLGRSVLTRRKPRSAPQPARARTRALSFPRKRPAAQGSRKRLPARVLPAPRPGLQAHARGTVTAVPRSGAHAPYRDWPALRPGDRVALFSPSSHQGQAPPDSIARAREILAGWGLRPDDPAPERRHLYLAGTDAERAGEFQRLYLDREVKALFSTRGGYGSARILPLLDRARIAAAPPKAVVGFSDVTALFAWLHWAARVTVVHGPGLAGPGAHGVAGSSRGRSDDVAGSSRERSERAPGAERSLEALRSVLFDPHPRPGYPAELIHLPGEPRPDSVTGRLVGGSLAIVVTTLGTPWALDTRGAILCLEDTDEAPYRIDRMLTHLRQAGRLDGVRAVVFGYLRRCDSEPPGLLDQVLRDVFHDAPYPVATGLPAGHGDPNLPMLLGRTARLDFDARGPNTPGRAHLQIL